MSRTHRVCSGGPTWRASTIPWLNVNAFYFGLNDQQPKNKNLHRTYSTYGLRLFKSPAINEFDYEFEGAIQTGHLGNVDHFAYNPNAEAGYTFNLPWTPRFLAQYTYASGTRTPGGSQDGTFDPLFGARRFDLNAHGNLRTIFPVQHQFSRLEADPPT